jgi:predicted nucleic acid-binding protein
VIIFDASYLVVLLHPNPAPARDRENKPVSQFKERVAHLVATMDASDDIIGVPTPAMSEVLVRAGAGREKYVSILSDRWKFQIISFDTRAAIEAAELVAAIKAKGERWDTWAKVKFDIQIVSIAKAEGATIIYSDDRDIENYAKRFQIKVIRICDLPLPPAPEVEDHAKWDHAPLGAQLSLLETPSTKQQSHPAEIKRDESELRTADASDEIEANREDTPTSSGSSTVVAEPTVSGEEQKIV